MMPSNARRIAVFGATGHTAAFVMQELQRRDFVPAACGRISEKLRVVRERHGIQDIRVAHVGEPTSLDESLCDVAAVINCAGPFGDTAIPLIDAARRAQVPYIDVTAEAAVVLDIFQRYGIDVSDIAIVPAMAFFGGLGDLLATAAMGDWTEAQRIVVAYGLSSWVPTNGTRATIAKREGRRLIFSQGRLQERTGETPALHAQWTFGEPFGDQEVATEITTADVVTIPHHLRVRDLHTYMNLAPIADLVGTSANGPVASDATGRSAQQFRIEVVASNGNEERRAIASGRDIYATTAPLVVEALERILAMGITGVHTAAQAFDPVEFLRAIEKTDPYFLFDVLT